MNAGRANIATVLHDALEAPDPCVGFTLPAMGTAGHRRPHPVTKAVEGGAGSGITGRSPPKRTRQSPQRPRFVAGSPHSLPSRSPQHPDSRSGSCCATPSHTIIAPPSREGRVPLRTPRTNHFLRLCLGRTIHRPASRPRSRTGHRPLRSRRVGSTQPTLPGSTSFQPSPHLAGADHMHMAARRSVSGQPPQHGPRVVEHG